MPGKTRSVAPGMARAIASPPETFTIGSASPCRTSVGARTAARRAVRSVGGHDGGELALAAEREERAVEAAPIDARGGAARRTGSRATRGGARCAGDARRRLRAPSGIGCISMGRMSGAARPTSCAPVDDMMMHRLRTRSRMADGDELRDEAAHRRADDVRRRQVERVEEAGGVVGHVVERVEAGGLGRQADVAVVVADDAEAARRRGAGRARRATRSSATRGP